MKEEIQVFVNNNNNNNKNDNKTPTLQYLAAVTSTLAIITDGMHYGWSSPSVPQLTNLKNCTICITKDEGSWLAVMPLIGAIIGSLTAANIVDIFGRKKTIIATSIPFFISWIMIAYGNTIIILYISRLIAGIADGITFTVVPMYIGEISNPNIRGMLGSSCSVTWIAGFLIINIIGSYLNIKNTALISSILPAILFLTFIWMPESPYYLLMRGNEDGARKSLKLFKRKKNVELDIERINNAILEERHNARGGGALLDLFRIKSNRKAVLIIGGLRGFQQLSGTTAIAFHTHEIFKSIGANMSEHWAVIIYYTVQLLMTILSSIIVDKAGRKPLLLISMLGTSLTLFFEGTYFYIFTKTNINISQYSYLATSGLIFFVIIFGLGMQSIPILMLGELFPTSVKAFALCLADVYFSIMATIATKFLTIIGQLYGYYMVFYGFTIFSLIGLLFILFFVPETKGKTLEEIQLELKGETALNKDKQEEEMEINSQL